MKIIKGKELTSAQKQEILELWNKEYPQELQYKKLSDLENYLTGLEDQRHMLLLDENDKVQGWYADFKRENERWFLVILDSEVQGRKFGARFMEMAKASHEELNGWVVSSEGYFKPDGEKYDPPLKFYQKLGFQILENVRLENQPISAIKIKWTKGDQ
ncbi:GNAT family N-acetyltransferase [Salinimicrobium catena]|uniref:GNAT family N-acetyltransferase n=1 Tax=Salinimicrobium catena TaxID=390640 RepID=UPI002FE43856